MTVGQVLRHLCENWCIVKMMVTNEYRFSSMEEIAEAMKLENGPTCTKAEAWAAMEKDLNDAVDYIKNELSDEDFLNRETTASLRKLQLSNSLTALRYPEKEVLPMVEFNNREQPQTLWVGSPLYVGACCGTRGITAAGARDSEVCE